jgi:2-polyprenyl-3-methyl-5-hydroxy-6-metoxy-1,4-benzoquinol methylase
MHDFSQRDVEFHRATAASYDEDVTDVYRKAREFPRGTVIDVRCGTVVSLALAERGFGVVANDHSSEMLAIAERKACEAGLSERIRFIQGDVRRLLFGDAAFDSATCQGSCIISSRWSPASPRSTACCVPVGSTTSPSRGVA